MIRKMMLIALVVALPMKLYPQCNTVNATTCQCFDSTSSDCDLLPNIEIGHPPFYSSGTYGIIEYSQTGNGVNNGRLKITVSTPNTGHGPLELRATDIYVCGMDTFTGTVPAICPDGISFPKILINQRIYHKTNNAMSYYDRAAGTMTYHPSHGHMHVDSWGIYTLRLQTPDPNPLNWTIVGTGTKLAFCVEDYASCPNYPNHCLDSLGNSLNFASDFPNYGLGGANYSCSAVVQGISSGFVDIYWTALDGMWINLPPTTCNGDYWIVVQIDPENKFIEENENDNIYAAPITLTQQIAANGNGYASITPYITQNICSGGSVTLTANAGIAFPGSTFLWSNGETTQAINVNTAGNYSVIVTSPCGTTSTTPVTVNTNSASVPTVQSDTICDSGQATLYASVVSGNIKWYDAPVSGTLLATGPILVTPVINATTAYYADNTEIYSNAQNDFAAPHTNTIGAGANYANNTAFIVFNALSDFTLASVKVYAHGAGNRTIELRDVGNNVQQTATVNLPTGESRAVLNFPITTGTYYRLGLNTGSNANLYRNSGGVSFSYTINNIVTIFNSSSGNANYYFFYDWEVLYDSYCVSPRIADTAYVENCTGISQQNFNNEILIYPNPANRQFTIAFENYSSSDVSIEVTDVTRKVVYKDIKYNITGNYKNTIDLKDASNGFYFVKIKAGKKEVKRKITLE
ncbi:MAG: T9SS type A sorting domain-containing protein [Bacteroidota bacterium]